MSLVAAYRDVIESNAEARYEPHKIRSAEHEKPRGRARGKANLAPVREGKLKICPFRSVRQMA